jgi:hypothetical protein
MGGCTPRRPFDKVLVRVRPGDLPRAPLIAYTDAGVAWMQAWHESAGMKRHEAA